MTRQLPPSPTATSQSVSKAMKGNKPKDTNPELVARKFLRDAGFRGYRLNYKGISGRPDICFVGKKIAIFVHGCFWHRCTKCAKPLPKTNIEFWKRKFELNVLRDQKKIESLENMGWNVFVVWECQLKKSINVEMLPIIKAIK